MPALYCTLHERLLSVTSNTWIDFSLEKIQAIQALYEGFHAVNIETSAYRVIETACDKCEAASVQRLAEKLKRIDPERSGQT